MAEETNPPKYEELQTKSPTTTGDHTKSILVKLSHRRPGSVNEMIKSKANIMSISLADKDLLRQTTDAISIPATISRADLTMLLWKRAQVHFGVEVIPDLVACPPDTPAMAGRSRGFSILTVEHGDDRVTVVDETGWQAAKAWLFDGTGSLKFEFALTPVVVPEVKVKDFAGKEAAAIAGKKHKGCVVQ